MGGLGITYDVHVRLIGKRVVDFLLVLIELFSLGVTVQSLRAKRDRKSAISHQRGHFLQAKSDFFTQIDRFAFFRFPLGDLGATYDDHLRLIISIN